MILSIRTITPPEGLPVNFFFNGCPGNWSLKLPFILLMIRVVWLLSNDF